MERKYWLGVKATRLLASTVVYYSVSLKRTIIQDWKRTGSQRTRSQKSNKTGYQEDALIEF